MFTAKISWFFVSGAMLKNIAEKCTVSSGLVATVVGLEYGKASDFW